MNSDIDENLNKVELLENVFTFENNKMKVFLIKKDEEPYKGYWQLPSSIIMNNQSIIEVSQKILEEQIDMKEIYMEQNKMYGDIDRNPKERTIAIAEVGIVDYMTYNLKKRNKSKLESQWFEIESLPKIAYDHQQIILDSIERLKEKLNNTLFLKKLFPTDFTLPEIQNIFEEILNKKLDRRNFRKKLIKMDLLEDTGFKSDGGNGRPAKLYKFKDDIKEVNLF